MDDSFTNRWMRKFRIMTISLIFSGALNIGFIALFLTFLVRDRQSAFFVAQPRLNQKAEEMTNQKMLNALAQTSFRELCSMLTNKEMVEEGFAKRDLALAVLVSLHDFNLEKALGKAPSERRIFKWGEQMIELFPSLNEDQFQAILHFAYLEKWPLTGKGLFGALQKNTNAQDETLMQAFLVTPEFRALQTLFQKSGMEIVPERLVHLASEGNWQILDVFVREQAQMLDFSSDRRTRLLLSYLALQSPTAATLLIETDYPFVSKRLDDRGLLDLLSRLSGNDSVQKLCLELLQSARSDAVHQKSAEMLYQMAHEEVPQPFDWAKALHRFVGPVPEKKESTTPTAKNDSEMRVHVVREGESLWKIARRYHVTVEELVALNHLNKMQLKPKMELKIPAAKK